jgi:hypothetical protein
MTRANILNGGAFCRTERVLGNTTSESEVDGAWVDRKDPNGKGWAQSAKLIINYSAVLVDGGNLTADVTWRDATSAAGAGAADYVAPSGPQVGDVANSGGETVAGTLEFDVDLSGANEFIQPQITLVASSSGTVAYSASLVLFGDREMPSTKALASGGGATDI